MQAILGVPAGRPDREVLVQPTTCDICAGGKIICAYHPTKPLGHDGCEDPGLPCPRCTIDSNRRAPHSLAQSI
jgi:hypothetical protein